MKLHERSLVVTPITDPSIDSGSDEWGCADCYNEDNEHTTAEFEVNDELLCQRHAIYKITDFMLWSWRPKNES